MVCLALFLSIRQSIFQRKKMALKKTWNVDKILSVSAIVVSTCALVVSILQTRIMQTQQEKSVWPHVGWYIKSGWQSDSTGSFSIKVVNKGIGPALIKDVTLVLDGQKYGSDQLRVVIEKIGQQAISNVREEQCAQTVLLPNDTLTYFEVANEKQAYDIAKIFAKNYEGKTRLDIIIQYSDVYGNEFVSSGNTKF
jgi:hypothetical protein